MHAEHEDKAHASNSSQEEVQVVLMGSKGSPLAEMKEQGFPPPVPWPAWTVVYCLIQVFVLQICLGYGGVGIYAAAMGTHVAQLPGLEKATVALAVELLEFWAVWLLLQDSLKPHLDAPAPWFKWRWDSSCVLPALVGWIASVAVCEAVVAAQHAPSFQSTGQVVQVLATNTLPTWLTLGVNSVVVAPALEEFVFRGFILSSLMKWMPTQVAVAFSALLFACYHLSPDELPVLWAMGIVLGTSYVASRGNIAASFAAHALYNATALGLLLSKQ